jgi:hypothetical protein
MRCALPSFLLLSCKMPKMPICIWSFPRLKNQAFAQSLLAVLLQDFASRRPSRRCHSGARARRAHVRILKQRHCFQPASPRWHGDDLLTSLRSKSHMAYLFLHDGNHGTSCILYPGQPDRYPYLHGRGADLDAQHHLATAIAMRSAYACVLHI